MALMAEAAVPHPQQHSSPLSPLRIDLTVLQFLGWPLKIVDKEATEVTSRKCCVLVVVFWVAWVSALWGIQMSLIYYSYGFSWDDAEDIMRKENITSWDEKSMYILYVPNFVRPFAIFCFYRGIDSKTTAFLKYFVRLGDRLPMGNTYFWLTLTIQTLLKLCKFFR